MGFDDFLFLCYHLSWFYLLFIWFDVYSVHQLQFIFRVIFIAWMILMLCFQIKMSNPLINLFKNGHKRGGGSYRWPAE